MTHFEFAVHSGKFVRLLGNADLHFPSIRAGVGALTEPLLELREEPNHPYPIVTS